MPLSCGAKQELLAMSDPVFTPRQLDAFAQIAKIKAANKAKYARTKAKQLLKAACQDRFATEALALLTEFGRLR